MVRERNLYEYIFTIQQLHKKPLFEERYQQNNYLWLNVMLAFNNKIISVIHAQHTCLILKWHWSDWWKEMRTCNITHKCKRFVLDKAILTWFNIVSVDDSNYIKVMLQSCFYLFFLLVIFATGLIIIPVGPAWCRMLTSGHQIKNSKIRSWYN